MSTEGSRYASFSVSPTGVLAYGRGGGRVDSVLEWFDRTGKRLGTVGEAGAYADVVLSPDGRRVAVSLISSTSPLKRDVWLMDVTSSIVTRLTFDPGEEASAVWPPDGSRIAFRSLGSTDPGIHAKLASGASGDELLLKTAAGSTLMTPTDWSRDGRFLAYSYTERNGSSDVWVLPLTGDRKPIPVAQSSFVEDHAVFSPDGHWLAYWSNESGANAQIYVQPFPPTGEKHQISKNGGTQPMWRGDGKELFFLGTDGTMMAVTVDATRRFEAGAPQLPFQSELPNTIARRGYSVTNDGQRFLMIGNAQRTRDLPITVLVNWQGAIQR